MTLKSKTKTNIGFFVITIIFTFITSLITIGYFENKEINRVSKIIVNNLYNQKVNIEKGHHFDNNCKCFKNDALGDIVFNTPTIQSIEYINSGHYISSTSSHYDDNGRVPIRIVNLLKLDRNTVLITNVKNNTFIYIFKFGTGYYKINYYLSLLKNNMHSDITNNRIYDIYQYEKSLTKTFNLYFKKIRYFNATGIVIESGFKFNNLMYLLLISFVGSSILTLLLLRLIAIVFNEQNIKYREIKKGIKNNEFIPYYQQVYSLNQCQFVGAEVLCRWKKNDKIIGPHHFISELEKHEEIKEVTFHLIKAAFDDLNKLENNDFRLSFNFTVKMILDQAFINKIINFIETTPNVKDKIIIELTESDNRFSKINQLKQAMLKLKEHGVLLSIDDFGTGYSNLYTIQELPFDIMKIDRAFISSQYAVSNSNMLEMMVDLGKSMDLIIVAEGMETEEELCRVKNLNIDCCQGFYFSTPCNSEKFIQGQVK